MSIDKPAEIALEIGHLLAKYPDDQFGNVIAALAMVVRGLALQVDPNTKAKIANGFDKAINLPATPTEAEVLAE